MAKVLGSRKNVFWEAFLLALIIFIFGIFLGLAFEARRVDEINKYYAQSEISLIDALTLKDAIQSSNGSCEDVYSSLRAFADRVYEEALALDKYSQSESLSKSIDISHKRYDLLRTLLWTNSIEARKQCKDISTVVYLYEYNTKDLANKATQTVWSRILFDLKQQKGNEILLIPIAVDTNLSSLNYLTGLYGIEKYPSVIINEKDVIYELETINDLNKFLNN